MNVSKREESHSTGLKKKSDHKNPFSGLLEAKNLPEIIFSVIYFFSFTQNKIHSCFHSREGSKSLMDEYPGTEINYLSVQKLN